MSSIGKFGIWVSNDTKWGHDLQSPWRSRYATMDSNIELLLFLNLYILVSPSSGGWREILPSVPFIIRYPGRGAESQWIWTQCECWDVLPLCCSVFPSSSNIWLQERDPIQLQMDLNSVLWLAHTIDDCWNWNLQGGKSAVQKRDYTLCTDIMIKYTLSEPAAGGISSWPLNLYAMCQAACLQALSMAPLV